MSEAVLNSGGKNEVNKDIKHMLININVFKMVSNLCLLSTSKSKRSLCVAPGDSGRKEIYPGESLIILYAIFKLKVIFIASALLHLLVCRSVWSILLAGRLQTLPVGVLHWVQNLNPSAEGRSAAVYLDPFLSCFLRCSVEWREEVEGKSCSHFDCSQHKHREAVEKGPAVAMATCLSSIVTWCSSRFLRTRKQGGVKCSLGRTFDQKLWHIIIILIIIISSTPSALGDVTITATIVPRVTSWGRKAIGLVRVLGRGLFIWSFNLLEIYRIEIFFIPRWVRCHGSIFEQVIPDGGRSSTSSI